MTVRVHFDAEAAKTGWPWFLWNRHWKTCPKDSQTQGGFRRYYFNVFAPPAKQGDLSLV